VPHRRELLADGGPIKLGGRAFDLLMALIETSGAVISKDELMRRVCRKEPGTVPLGAVKDDGVYRGHSEA